MKSPSRQTRSGRSAASASAARSTASSPACGMPAWRSVSTPTRSPSSAAGQRRQRRAPRAARRAGAARSRATRRRGRPLPRPPPVTQRSSFCLSSSEPRPTSPRSPRSSKPPPVVPEAGPDLLELGGVEGRAEALQALAVVEAELGGEVVALEQADVVDPAGERLGRLDLDRAVALEARGRRDQLPDDHVLLQAREAVDLALERRVGEDLRGLLEGGRRQERVRRQRRLGDAEDDLLGLGALLALRDDRVVDLAVLVAVDELPRQEVRVALLVDPDLLEHLAHDQLDVLVVDVHALGLVDLLHLLDEVDLDAGAPLGRRLAAVRQQLVRVQVALVELLADLDLLRPPRRAGGCAAGTSRGAPRRRRR